MVCVRADDYPTSLELHKIYAVKPDADAERDGDLRIIDESGDDYLFSADRFVAIEVPAAVKASLRGPGTSPRSVGSARTRKRSRPSL